MRQLVVAGADCADCSAPVDWREIEHDKTAAPYEALIHGVCECHGREWVASVQILDDIKVDITYRPIRYDDETESIQTRIEGV